MEKEKAKKTKPTWPAYWGGGASWSTQRGLPNVRRGEELLGGPAPHTHVAADARRKWVGGGLEPLVDGTVSPSSFLVLEPMFSFWIPNWGPSHSVLHLCNP